MRQKPNSILDCLTPRPKNLRAAIFAGPPTSAIPAKPPSPKVDANEAPSDFQTGQVTLNSLRPVCIVNQRSDRASLKITNLQAVEIAIYSDPGKSAMWDLLPSGRGQWVSFATKSPVYGMALSASSSPILVSFLETYGDGE